MPSVQRFLFDMQTQSLIQDRCKHRLSSKIAAESTKSRSFLLSSYPFIVLVNKCAMADESARLGPWVDVGSLLSAELDVEVDQALALGCWLELVGSRVDWLLSLVHWMVIPGWLATHFCEVATFSCKNGPRRDHPTRPLQQASQWSDQLIFFFLLPLFLDQVGGIIPADGNWSGPSPAWPLTLGQNNLSNEVASLGVLERHQTTLP